MLNALESTAMQEGWQGQPRGHDIQAGGLAWAVSHLSPGWFAAWGPRWQGHPGDLTTDVMEKGSACCIVGYHAGLRAVSCLSSVLWVKDFGLG